MRLAIAAVLLAACSSSSPEDAGVDAESMFGWTTCDPSCAPMCDVVLNPTCSAGLELCEGCLGTCPGPGGSYPVAECTTEGTPPACATGAVVCARFGEL
jgi:hypothetical protein